jgi:general secretion pathway protein K
VRHALRRRDPGAALLVVIVSVAILTAIAVDLAYNTRVSLLTAANIRDELRAEYLARGATQLSRLVLQFQQQLDGAAGSGPLKVQVWSLVPVTSALTEGLFGAGEGQGGPPATFEAKIEDEGTKVNAQLDSLFTGSNILGAQVEALLELVGDPRWDPLFDREDANGLKVTRTDLAVNLYDWTDPNSTGSAFNVTLNPPFADGFGDENQPYSRGDDRYETKNARFDSLDELYLVAGIDDALMAAFGSHLTVYPRKDAPFNVNSRDPTELALYARMLADPKQQPVLADATFPQRLLKAVMDARQGGVVAFGGKEFADVLRSLDVMVGSATNVFTDRALVFRIRATGTAGAAERRVEAVVSFDAAQNGGQPPPDGGRLLHWREE